MKLTINTFSNMVGWTNLIIPVLNGYLYQMAYAFLKKVKNVQSGV